MSPNLVGAIANSFFEIIGGLYLFLLSKRLVGKKPGVDAKLDQFIEKNGTLLQIGGPALFIFGLWMFFSSL
jgi:hypothetical protein